MASISIKSGGAEQFNKSNIQSDIINLYFELNKEYAKGNDKKGIEIETKIDKLKKKLKLLEISIFYDNSTKKLLSYSDTIMIMENRKKQTLFNIAESTGGGNYKPVEKWTYVEIIDYLNFKEAQINKINSQRT